MTLFNWNLILHAKILTSPIKDIDAFYFAVHGEYEKKYTTTLNQMYPTQSTSTYTHTHIYLLRRFLVKGT